MKAMLTACLMAAAMFLIPSTPSAVLPHDVCEGPAHAVQEPASHAGLCERHK